MTAGIQRYVSAGVLAIWGVVLAYFYFTDRIGHYLHPAFHPWTIASGVVLLLMAAGTLFLPQEEHDCCGADDHGPDVPPGDRWHVHDPKGGCCGQDHTSGKSPSPAATITAE